MNTKTTKQTRTKRKTNVNFFFAVETGGKHVLVPSEVHAEAEKYAKVRTYI